MSSGWDDHRKERERERDRDGDHRKGRARRGAHAREGRSSAFDDAPYRRSDTPCSRRRSRSRESERAPRLLSLVVHGPPDADVRNGVCRVYCRNEYVVVRAVTDPDTPAVWDLLEWAGDGESTRWDSDRRISRREIGEFEVRVLLNEDTRRVRILVSPFLLRLDVPDAVEDVNGWRAPVHSANALTLTARTNPASPAAWRSLTWHDGTTRQESNELPCPRNVPGVFDVSVSLSGITKAARIIVVAPELALHHLQFDTLAIENDGLGAMSDAYLCYKRNTPITITPTFSIAATVAEQTTIRVEGTATIAGAQYTWAGDVNVAPGNVGTSVAGPAMHCAALPDVVGYHDVEIVWTQSWSGGAPKEFRRTRHFICVTLADAVPLTVRHLTPLVHSCWYAAGETTAAGVVSRCFDALTPKSMRRTRDSTPLQYWDPTAPPHYFTLNQSLVNMLRNDGKGSCLAWAQMLQCMYAVHGISGTLVHVESELRFDGAAHGVGQGATMQIRDRSAQGTNGQHSPPEFSNHYIVRDPQGRYWDPSYGAGPFVSAAAWRVAALSGVDIAPNTWLALGGTVTINGPAGLRYSDGTVRNVASGGSWTVNPGWTFMTTARINLNAPRVVFTNAATKLEIERG